MNKEQVILFSCLGIALFSGMIWLCKEQQKQWKTIEKLTNSLKSVNNQTQWNTFAIKIDKEEKVKTLANRTPVGFKIPKV